MAGITQRAASALASTSILPARAVSSSIRTPSSAPARTVALKVLPSPGMPLATMSPPSARANLRLMVRPRPVPPKRRWTLLSACTKGSKISAALSGAMPMPVSRTSKRSSAGSFEASSERVTVTLPCSVNLIALPIRLVSTWRIRGASVCTVSGMRPWTRSASASPFSPALTLIALTTWCASL